jgi:predicted transcriptional regulator
MDDEFMKLFAYMKISSYRLKTLNALYEGDKNPTQISKTTGIRVTHTSNVLRDFKDRDIVICLNEDRRKNRVYQLTDLGREIAEFIEEQENKSKN